MKEKQHVQMTVSHAGQRAQWHEDRASDEPGAEGLKRQAVDGYVLGSTSGCGEPKTTAEEAGPEA